MPINFPASPTNGQEITHGDGKLVYNSAKGIWNHFSTAAAAESSGGGGSSVTTSDTAPTSPNSGDQWFDTTSGTLYIYYNDGTSSQWIGVSGPSGADGADGTDGASVTAYANFAAFSNGTAEGDFAFAQDNKALYVWDGTEWDRIYHGSNENPLVTTEPNALYSLAIDGTATTANFVATDPEGFPIEYSFSTNPANQQQATITNTGSTFTITPTTNPANGGEFDLRFQATDGITTTTRTSTVALFFYNAYDVQYTNATTGNIVEIIHPGSGVYNLDNDIDALSLGDAIRLTDGAYEVTPDSNTSAGNWWRSKQIAIVGKTKDPADVILNLLAHGGRDKGIFVDNPTQTSYYNHFANMRIVRHAGTGGTNYMNTLRRFQSGGYIQNCIIDLNAGDVAWNYDNGNSTTPVGSFINCSFVNYANWVANYSGNNAAIRAVNCAFDAGFTTSVTQVGTNQSNVSFAADYSYTGSANYGHLKDITATPTVSVGAP